MNAAECSMKYSSLDLSGDFDADEEKSMEAEETFGSRSEKTWGMSLQSTLPRSHPKFQGIFQYHGTMDLYFVSCGRSLPWGWPLLSHARAAREVERRCLGNQWQSSKGLHPMTLIHFDPVDACRDFVIAIPSVASLRTYVGADCRPSFGSITKTRVSGSCVFGPHLDGKRDKRPLAEKGKG